MNCKRAKELIDIRIHGGDAGRDRSKLDDHLASCSRCVIDYEELLRTRKLLGTVATDSPTSEEIDTMWTAIASAGPFCGPAVGTPTRGRLVGKYVAAAVGAAAVIVLAFQIGHLKYGGQARQRVAMKQIKRDATSSRVDRGTGKQNLDTVGAYEWSSLASSVQQFLSPSSGDEDELATEFAADSLGSGEWSDNAASFGYNVLRSQKLEAKAIAGVERRTRREAPGASYRRKRRRSPKGRASSESTVVGREFTPAKVPPAPPLPEPEGLPGTRQGARFYADDAAEPRYFESMDYDRDSSDGDEASYGGGMAVMETDLDGLDRQPARPARLPPQPDAVSAQQSAQQRQPIAQPKIIKTGELGVEVESYEEAVKQVETIVRQARAFVADASTRERSGGALSGRIVIRVYPERFDVLFAALKTTGRVESESVKAADVTAEYVDLEARINTLQITEQRLQELIKDKSFLDEVTALLEVERELTRVRSQIEQLQGQLRVMADRIALSTITVTLREPERSVPSASMSVEVATLDEAATALGEALDQLHGRLKAGDTSKRDDGTLKGSYVLEISLARFTELLEAIESLGRIEERHVTDRQFGDATAPWATKIKCRVALGLFERSRQLPSGDVSIEVEALPAALEQLDKLLVDCGGLILSNRTSRHDDGSSEAELDLRAPAGRFATLIDSLAVLGRTTAKSIAGEAGRIVGGAASVPCSISLTLAERVRQVPSGGMLVEVDRFEAARKLLSKLVAEKGVQVLGSDSRQRTDGTWMGNFRLGIKAADMEEAVAVLESLGRVEQRQISGLGLGDLSRSDPDALGVISLTLAEKGTITPGPDRAGDRIRQRLREALAGLYSSLGMILYGLIVLTPWLIIVLLIAWPATRAFRKRKATTQPAAP